jgi:basic amino acid/polyamine antiporter, APA family
VRRAANARRTARRRPRPTTVLSTMSGRTVGTARCGSNATPSPAATRPCTTRWSAGARTLVLVTAVVTIAATANAMVVVSSRVLFGMARDGHLPARLGQLGSARGTPVASVLISGGLIGLVALVAFTQGAAGLARAARLLYVLHYLPPLIGLTIVRRREPTPPTGVFTTPAAGLVLPRRSLAASSSPWPAGARPSWSAPHGCCWVACIASALPAAPTSRAGVCSATRHRSLRAGPTLHQAPVFRDLPADVRWISRPGRLSSVR